MSLADKLAGFKGLEEAKTAIMRMCGDEELYLEALKLSAEQVPVIAGELDGQMAGNDMGGFAINIHGLKGALNTIGACGYADMADKLCKSARAGDSSAVRAGWAELRPQLIEFAENIGTL